MFKVGDKVLLVRTTSPFTCKGYLVGKVGTVVGMDYGSYYICMDDMTLNALNKNINKYTCGWLWDDKELVLTNINKRI